MSQDVKMKFKPPRSKSLDLRRKVLLKNFFKKKGIYFNSSAGFGDTMDFSKRGDSYMFDNEDPIDVENQDENEKRWESVCASVEEDCAREAINEDLISTATENLSDPFSFNTMRTALPSSTSCCSSNSIDSALPDEASVTDEPDSTTCDVIPEIKPGFRAKMKLSLRKRPFSRRKSSETKTSKVPIIKRKSKSKHSLSPTKSTKKSFKTRFNGMFMSKPSMKSKKSSKLRIVNEKAKIRTKESSHRIVAVVSGLSRRSNSQIMYKSVSVQTDSVCDCYNKDSCNYLELQHLRLENRRLRGKLQFLTSLNERENCSGQCVLDFNGALHSTNMGHCESSPSFQSNRENKTDYRSSTRLTRSQSIQESSRCRDNTNHEKPRHRRRSRSICVAREEALRNTWFYNRPNTPQPFKPMQSIIRGAEDSPRKRKSEPVSIKKWSQESTYGKRYRSISTSYNPPI